MFSAETDESFQNFFTARACELVRLNGLAGKNGKKLSTIKMTVMTTTATASRYRILRAVGLAAAVTSRSDILWTKNDLFGPPKDDLGWPPKNDIPYSGVLL
jgi:hypothetical protein